MVCLIKMTGFIEGMGQISGEGRRKDDMVLLVTREITDISKR